ncbi:hypothetical protein GPALN_010791 [Globodera pallida]|nr:hypothetical protein GPALN_010791 [Globodera pallida]
MHAIRTLRFLSPYNCPTPNALSPKNNELTKWNSDADALHPQRTLSEPVQPSDSTPSEPKEQPSDPKFSNHSFIAIGLCAKQMPLNAELGDKNSYAYQSCGLFAAHSVPMLVDSNGIKIPMFRAGNVVGCGVNLKNNELFYTLNGERLGTAARFNSTDELYPCVTLSKSGDEIKANFGPDFIGVGENGSISLNESIDHLWPKLDNGTSGKTSYQEHALLVCRNRP